VRQRILFLSLAIVVSIVLAACGIGNAAAKPTPDPMRAMLAFSQCMRTHGLTDFPDPKPDGSGFHIVNLNVDPTTFQAAQNACRSKLRNAGLKTPNAAEMAQERDHAVKFAECMRAHGINMPDPQFGNGGILQRSGGDIDPNSAGFQAANRACGAGIRIGGQ